MDLFACLVDGHLHGPAWRGTLGGGFLVSPSLEFTSDDTVFLYPDCLTALEGRFEDGVMVEAREGRVVGAAGFCGPRCGAVRPAVEVAAEGEVREVVAATAVAAIAAAVATSSAAVVVATSVPASVPAATATKTITSAAVAIVAAAAAAITNTPAAVVPSATVAVAAVPFYTICCICSLKKRTLELKALSSAYISLERVFFNYCIFTRNVSYFLK